MGEKCVKYYLGVDIGGTKCAVSAGDEDCRVLEKVRFETKGKDSTLGEIVSAAKHLCGKYDISSVGISCGGPLDGRRGLILSPPNLPGWDEVPITKILSGAVNRPAYLLNDADAGALAEWKFGAGKGTENMIFLTFGTGLGAGLILGGRLYTGACNMAGEAGHIRLEDDGPEGYGKAGSFEGFCSGGGILRLATSILSEKLSRGESFLYCPSADALGGLNTKILADAAKAGDETATEIFRISGKYLGRGLAVLVDILNPELIVIGSIFTRCGELFRTEMQKELEKEALSRSLSACRVAPAALGEDTGDIAALVAAKYYGK